MQKDLYLVTGGAGFVGSNLCEALLASGARVRCLDNLSAGKMENMAGFLQNPDFEFVKGDIRDFDTCLRAASGARFVLHQAALASVPGSLAEPGLYFDVNVGGTENMLRATVECTAEKFVYASSSAVYGDSQELPKREGCEGKPLSPYAENKLACEGLAKKYTKEFGLATVGLRYFNVYGRRQDPNGPYAAVIPKFITSLLSGKAPTIFGDGEQSRDFTYIEDVVSANLLACKAGAIASGKAYNIACGSKKTINEIFGILAQALGSELAPTYAPARPGDILHSYADASLARQLLGYKAAWGFERGIAECIEWYR